MSAMRVLVTGATGFIGGCLARSLAAQGHDVRALVRREAPDLTECGIEPVAGDVADAGSLRAALRGVDAIFHLAAVRDSYGMPASVYRRVNVEGTRAMLEAAVAAGVARFVHCSSVGVARYPGKLDADETLPYSEPTSQVLYHETKAEAEELALATGAIVVRPVITYGPGDRYGFVTRLISLLARGRFVGVGDGRNHVDLVYVDDLTTGMAAALEKGTPGEVYILSGTAPIEVRALVSQICTLLGKRPPRLSIPAPAARIAGWGIEMLWRGAGLHRRWGNPPLTRDAVATLAVDRGFSHRRASAVLGYEPRVDYGEGLRVTWEWIAGQGGFPTE